ncbi:MAG: 4'-phosphopantetheinyl transferase superfamily protein [Myxococcota bacterium]|nr:4'-phosphopantetheinyl transferase superfamily protein [Myxococcota bacterium]
MTRPLIGNDVVDLRDPEARPGASHPRFERRVFGDRERRSIEASACRERSLWAHWAAKEAAFKALRRQRPDLPFHPRGFEVSLRGRLRPRVSSLLRGDVRVSGLSLPVFARIDAERVHAWVGGATQVAAERIRPGACPSESARALALAMARTRFPGEALRVEREDRIPTLVRTPFRTTAASNDDVGSAREPDVCRVPLSLSHHGRFVACAIGALEAAA